MCFALDIFLSEIRYDINPHSRAQRISNAAHISTAEADIENPKGIYIEILQKSLLQNAAGPLQDQLLTGEHATLPRSGGPPRRWLRTCG